MGKGAATRERILDIAFRLAARDGLDGLSLGDLASAASVSKSGLFAHFTSKEELQVDILKTAAARWEETVLRPALQRPRGLPRIRAVFENWLRWGNDPAMPGGCMLAAAATELDDREGPARDYLVSSQRAALAALTHAARLAVEQGHFRRDLDCDQFAFQLYTTLVGFNQMRRLLRDPKGERRVRAAFEELVRSAST